MVRTLGYMITFTTYGTWLQGDERGYVKEGKIYPANKALMQSNKQLQLQDAILLSTAERQLVREAIINEAKTRGQKIYAISVQPNHVHIVVDYTQEPLSKIVALYKSTSRLALRALERTGKVWTRGYDKRFCFTEDDLRRRIKYVQSQNPA